MPSKPRQFFPGSIHHIYNRGVQKMNIFHGEKDYNRFLMKMQEYKDRYLVEILVYCLMPNHFHFLMRESDNERPGERPLRPEDLEGQQSKIPLFLQQLQNSHAKYFSSQYDLSGRLFQGTYKSKQVTNDAYFLTLCAYIHDNPVRAMLVKKPTEWGWSSYSQLMNPTLKVIPTFKVDEDSDLTDVDQARVYKQFTKNRQKQIESIREFI